MINSKLRAYKYFNNQWEKVSRWELIKMSDVEYRKFKELHFPLFLTKSKESPKLTFNNGQKTFRYYPNQGINENHTSKGLTISHLIAQEVISDIRILNLKLKDKRTKPYQDKVYKIEVDNIITEKKMVCGENTYYADLLVLFSKPAKLSLQWNGFFSLEIFVTKDVEGNKIIDYEKKKIPVIEIAIGPKLKLKKSASDVSEKEEDNLRDFMNVVFRKQIFGNILVSPTSDKYKENEIIIKLNDTENKVIELKSNIVNKNNEIETLVNRNNQLYSSNTNLNNTILSKNEQVNSLNNEISELKNKSRMNRIMDVFK
ncbi:hypothetical protein ACXR6G_14020 [Ancylomarina sp. YFZ004]